MTKGLVEEIQKAKQEHVPEIGIAWAAQQAEALINANIPVVHFYVMQDTEEIKRVLAQL